jgi:hypothetical protein
MKFKIGLFTVAAALATATPAAAELLQLRAELHGGGSGGVGIAGDQQDDAFHDGATGAVYGVSVGVEFLFVDGWVQHDQYVTADDFLGTWTQFMLGFDTEIPVGEKTKGTQDVTDKQGRTAAEGGYAPTYIELGMAVGFGVGTGQQVDPPLDAAQVTDRGFLVQAHAGFGYRLNRVISLGITVPVQAGYMFKSGVANDLGNHYQSIQAAVLANLRLSFTLK